MESRIIVLGLFVLFVAMATTSDTKERKRKSWKDKDIRDMTDADLENLLDQWEENDETNEPLEPDELPEHLRPAPKIDISKIDVRKPDGILALKKGKSIMMFIDLNSNVSEEEANIATGIWQTGLQNNHIIAERYPIENKRYIFMFHDGSQAIEGKNFFLQQPEVAHVTVEGQTFYPPQKDGQHSIPADKPKAKERTEEL